MTALTKLTCGGLLHKSLTTMAKTFGIISILVGYLNNLFIIDKGFNKNFPRRYA